MAEQDLLTRLQETASAARWPTKTTLTPEGGMAVLLTNKTGSNSVAGMLVQLSNVADSSFEASEANDNHPIGVVYNAGIADGSGAWVVISGCCSALLADGTTSTAGNWVQVSVAAAGRVLANTAEPPGGGVVGLDRHMQEVGHCAETKGSGTDVLALIFLHFN